MTTAATAAPDGNDVSRKAQLVVTFLFSLVLPLVGGILSVCAILDSLGETSFSGWTGDVWTGYEIASGQLSQFLSALIMQQNASISLPEFSEHILIFWVLSVYANLRVTTLLNAWSNTREQAFTGWKKRLQPVLRVCLITASLMGPFFILIVWFRSNLAGLTYLASLGLVILSGLNLFSIGLSAG